ncbi:MAG: hypothetical protein GX868_12945 [Actinobacteria bacterium]|nr:hypothetical protein [Actinomycetota bacterium]
MSGAAHWDERHSGVESDLLASGVSDLVVDRAERLRRRVGSDGAVAIDCIVRAHRLGATSET